MRGETHPINAKMTRNTNILNELTELNSSLVNVSTQNAYMVPVGYFDGLAVTVLNRIKAMNAENVAEELNYLSPILSNISKQTPYTVPAGYFDSLAETALQSVRENSNYQTAKEEIETLSPLLSGLKKQMPYSVPQGYFENIAEKSEKQKTRVISITSRKWFRYSAAAIVVGIVAISGLLIFGNKKTAAEKILVKVEKDVKKMDDQQKNNLADFLDAGMNGKETAKVNADDKSQEIKDLLQGVSEEELTDFQHQTEDIEDVLMND